LGNVKRDCFIISFLALKKKEGEDSYNASISIGDIRQRFEVVLMNIKSANSLLQEGKGGEHVI